MIVGYDS